MKNWTVEEEGEALGARFEGMNRAAFARETKIKGGQAIVHQHIKGIRPISLDAALIYATYFHCSLSEISPRLSDEVAVAAKFLGSSAGVPEPRAPYLATQGSWPFAVPFAQYEKLSATQKARLNGFVEGMITAWGGAEPKKKSA